MRALLAPTVSAAVTLGCATITTPPTPESTRIEVSMPVAKAAAYEQVLAAFVSEGANVASGSVEGGTVTSVPVRHGQATGHFIYRATLLGQRDTTRVILSGGVVNETYGAFFGTESPEQPLHSQMRGLLGEAWQRVERIAARLRSGS